MRLGVGATAGGLLYQDLIKSREVRAGQRLPAVFPIVIYNGQPRWGAARDVADLITAPPPSLHRALLECLKELIFPGTIDEDRLPLPSDLEESNAMLAERIAYWREESRLAGRADMLGRQLTRRFGPLPDWAQTRLDTATVEQLDTWADAILDAPTLNGVIGTETQSSSSRLR